MHQAFNEVILFIQQGLEWILKFFLLIWNWSFGEIADMFETQLANFGLLPFWKQMIIGLVIAAIIYLLYYLFRDVVLAIKQVLEAFITVLKAIVQNLPHVLIAGVIAAGGSWVINNVTVSWWP